MASSEIIFLKDEKLRELSQLIRNHEVNNLYHLTFQNLGDQLQYLRMCNDNMASVNTLLDECNALVAKYKKDDVRGPIASLILGYAENCLNNALQIIRNYTLRKTYLDRMMDHHHQLFQALEELDTCSKSDVADFTHLILEYDQKVISYMMLSVNTHASQEFSRYLRNTGIGFHELVQRYQTKLGYTGRFDELEEGQKLEVYAAIIEASGRLSVVNERGLRARSNSNALSSDWKGKTFKYGSAAMFMMDVGQIVWDVYASNHPLTTATREALELAAKKGGSALGKLVGAAIATQLAGVEASALFITAAGILGGFGGGFIFGAAAGLLFDLIFGSGGEAVLPTDGFILYVAPMPNGQDLAKQIAHI